MASITPAPDILAAFARRDPSAVRTLYRQYGRLVYGVAFRALGRADLAEDATQQTFVRAWQAAGRFDVTRDPAPWLATIAKHVAIDMAEYEARRATVLAAEPPLAPSDADTLDLVWQVREAIESLPADEALIVRRQHLEGMTQREIADELGIALGTVKSRSHRAHRKLAAQLADVRAASVA